jgi:hypothetical protein
MRASVGLVARGGSAQALAGRLYLLILEPDGLVGNALVIERVPTA